MTKVKKDVILKVNRRDFLDWYYDCDMIKELGSEVYESLLNTGEFSINADDIVGDVGYIPIDLINNREAINIDDVKDEEICEPNNRGYKVIFEGE